MQARGRFGVLVGMDGSGKSTVLQLLQQDGYLVADWRNLRSFEDVSHLSPPHPGRIRAKLRPFSRAMFVGARLVAEYEYLVEPMLSTGQSILLDSYYFKWLAKETIYAKTHPIFFSVCSALPKPDVLIVIQVPTEVAFARKGGNLSQFEYLKEPTLDDFQRFQGTLMDLILTHAEGIPVITIDGNHEAAVVASALSELLEELGWGLSKREGTP